MSFQRLNTDKYHVYNDIKKLFIQKYERYLPTAFDQSSSLLEKMNKLIESQNKLIDIINDHREYTDEQLQRSFNIIDTNLGHQLQRFRSELEDYKKLYEEIRDKVYDDLLPENIHSKMEEWLLNGTIEDMIMESVFPKMVERIISLENRVDYMQYSVKDYGAEGDGVRDDTKAFKDAISRHKKVYVPAGDYIINETLYLPEGTHLIGDNGYLSTIHVPHTIPGILLGNSDNVTIEGMGFTHNADLRNYERRVFSSFLITDVENGGSRNVTIKNNVFQDIGAMAIRPYARADKDWNVTGNHSFRTGREFLFCLTAERFNVSHNIIHNTGDDGVALNATTTHSVVSNNMFKNIGINDNPTSSGSGVKIHGYGNVVEGNTIKDCNLGGIGLWTETRTGNPHNNLIIDNVIEGLHLRGQAGETSGIQVKGAGSVDIISNIIDSYGNPDVNGVLLDDSVSDGEVNRPVFKMGTVHISDNKFIDFPSTFKVRGETSSVIFKGNVVENKRGTGNVTLGSISRNVDSVVITDNNILCDLRTFIAQFSGTIQDITINDNISLNTILRIIEANDIKNLDVYNNKIAPNELIAGTSSVANYDIGHFKGLKAMQRGQVTIPTGEQTATVQLDIPQFMTVSAYMIRTFANNASGAVLHSVPYTSSHNKEFRIMLKDPATTQTRLLWEYEYRDIKTT